MTFRGTFEHTLDAKHRLTMPAKYRADLSGPLVIAFTPGAVSGSEADCLSIWPLADYDAYAQAALANINPLSPTAQALRRTLNHNSWDAELDSANRLMIPARAMTLAALTKEVVIAGSDKCLEVWDRERHASYNTAILAQFPQIVERFDHTD